MTEQSCCLRRTDKCIPSLFATRVSLNRHETFLPCTGKGLVMGSRPSCTEAGEGFTAVSNVFEMIGTFEA